MDAERAWESLTLEDHKRLSDAFLAGGAEAGVRFLGKEAFLLGWQKATECGYPTSAHINSISDKCQELLKGGA